AAARRHLGAALRDAAVAAVAWRDREAPEPGAPGAPLALALTALEGADALADNMPAGTIFALRPAAGPGPGAAFLAPGRVQVAAGFAAYGPRTLLALTGGAGVRIFALDPREDAFRLVRDGVRLPAESPRYAIDAAQGRHWEAPVRAFAEDCARGADGPRGRDFAHAWCGSLVAGAQRILSRGGLHVCPADARRGRAEGHVRLVHEAAPLALLMEAAGGAATDGRGTPVLDLSPAGLHGRTPFAFGSAGEVDCLAKYHDGRRHAAGRSPLFAPRGLLRA
ncbi:class 1 fructose-bisphosphatase, partial [Methylobacterium crusticola]